MLRTDRETIARSDDHRALRIWLRLLTCTQLIEKHLELIYEKRGVETRTAAAMRALHICATGTPGRQ